MKDKRRDRSDRKTRKIRKKLLDDLKERREYSHLKEELILWGFNSGGLANADQISS